MLKVDNLHVYWRYSCFKGISLEVPENKIVTPIGANGAGKVLLKDYKSLVPSTSGKITFWVRYY